MRRKFSYVFSRESPNGDPDDIAALPTSSKLSGSSVRGSRAGSGGVGRGGGGRQGSKAERAVTGCRRGLFGVDPKHADSKLFMILQLSKVLQGEPEKVSGVCTLCPRNTV